MRKFRNAFAETIFVAFFTGLFVFLILVFNNLGLVTQTVDSNNLDLREKEVSPEVMVLGAKDSKSKCQSSTNNSSSSKRPETINLSSSSNNDC